MNSLIVKLLSILFFTIPNFVFADNVVKYLSNIDGLTNNSVNCIFEDSENILWFGTWDGLNAYNGRDIRTFRYSRNNKNSISNNIIRQIIEQDETTLWVSTDNGVNRLDKRTQKFTNYFLGTENQPPKQERSFILNVTSQKIIVCFVKEQGLFYYDNADDCFRLTDIKLKNDVKDIIIDNEDNLYILYQDGRLETCALKHGNGIISGDSLANVLKNSSSIDKIFFTGNRIILSTSKNITVLNKSHTVIKEINITDYNKSVSQSIIYKNILYVSFYEGGCITIDLTSNIKKSIQGIPDKTSIFTMYMGSQDILWVGSDGQGVLMIYDYTSPFSTIQTDYPVRSFCENERGDILIGTKGGGIKLFNKRSQSLINYLGINKGLISNSVYTIKKNKSNDIFIGTEGDGINILYSKSNKLEKLSVPSHFVDFKAVYSLYFTDSDSILWVGTSGYGLIKIHLANINDKYIAKKVEQFVSTDMRRSLNNDVIYTIIEAPYKNKLWFGTRGGGLNSIDITTNEIEQFSDVNSDIILTNNDILCLQNSVTGLWIGTSYGLNKLYGNNRKSDIKQYTDNEGLNNNTIHGILEDENQKIWVSTNQGISLIDPMTNFVENYTLKDGLQSDEFSDGASFKDKHEYLYFGGVNGFNYFKPDLISLRNFASTLKLSGLKIYNTTQNIHEQVIDNILNLSYDERYVTFAFVTNDYINNENCEYAYRLLNYSDEWINNGNNPNIVFAKLAPGKYQLEVKSTNGNKVWSDNSYLLNINVAYPWWLSAPAIIAYIILALIALYITQSIIKSRIRLNRQILLEKIEKHHQQKEHESKLNFFTNVAHEFFTPLTLIYGPAQHLLENINLDSYTKRYVHIIKNNAERMQKLISELMEFRKAKSGHTSLYPENIDIKLLVNYISDNYMDMSQVSRIDYKVSVNDTSTLCSDRDFLEKIFLNLFSNAFKYTPKDGYIHVTVWQEGSTRNLKMTIRNSGTGLTEHQMTEIFDKYKIFDSPRLQNTVSTGVGLNLTKSLTELLGGSINVYSKYGEYVEFTLDIPALETKEAKNENSFAHKDEVLYGTDTIIDLKTHEGINILIVEDEKNIRELLKDILSSAYNILEAADGKHALDIIEQNHPDIIISDVLMPNLDGMSLIRILRANPKTMHIPIISISAKNSIEDHISAYEHGADLYITKPFHPRHILSTIENLINKQSILKEYFTSGISSVKMRDGIEIHQDDEKLIHEIVAFITKNLEDESMNPNSIASFIGISKATLYRKLKEITDNTPSEFVRSIRLEHASKLLISTKFTVSEIMFKSGFSNKSYFYREFAKQYAASPKEFRDNNTQISKR